MEFFTCLTYREEIHMAFYFGDESSNTKTLGGAADFMFGFGGNDKLSGDGGNDLIDGGDGNDTLDGGNGSDVVVGDHGNDTLLGGSGDDGMDGGSGNDNINGEAGNDLLFGRGGADSIRGGVGGDVILGGEGNDRLWGEAGDDRLYGESGDDILNGGSGRDALNGGQGNDVFDYDALSDSPGFEETNPTVIRDDIFGFNGRGDALGDRIDLSTIDANRDVGGNQAFNLNQLTYSNGILTATVIGIGIPGSLDLQVHLVGSPPLDLSSGTNDIIL
jgi:Ca2+-binding RTX toxin-like protein